MGFGYWPVVLVRWAVVVQVELEALASKIVNQ
jgi:hypothetical protein